MTGFTDAEAQARLDALVTAYPFVALFRTVGTDAGSGFLEADYTSYARVSTSGLWSAAAGSSPATKSNSGTISFPTSTSGGTALVGWGLYSLVSGGNLGYWGYLGNFSWVPATFSNASPSIITIPGHGFANGDQVVATTEFGSEGTIPGGFTAGILTVAGVTTDTFNVGVNASNTGGLMFRKITSQSVISGMLLQWLAGQITLSLG